MRLIIGGSYQGKLAYAFRLVGQEKDPEKQKNLVADGDVDSLEAACNHPIVDHVQSYIRRILEEAGNSEETVISYIDRIQNENPQVILVMDEIGYGIVPMSQAERIYRECVGRAGQRLALEAESVDRVVCGIATKIK
ncbi:MAG: bifunctional adenosylcobinamide kinase/adenosylcobinamide-phosphate guanylyltransferase [Hungatella sp.]